MKKYYYILVRVNGNYQYVTQINNKTRAWSSDLEEKPLSFSSMKTANNICEGIFLNSTECYVVQSFFELQTHNFVEKKI